MPIRIRLFLVILFLTLIPLLFLFLMVPQISQIIFTGVGETAFLSALFILVVMVTLAALFVALQFTLPLIELKELARRVETGDLEQSSYITSHDEIGELAGSFNSMISTLRKQQGMKKKLDRDKDEFLSITAHHLRTPLGSLRWNFELLLDNKYGVLSPKLKEILMNMSDNNLDLIALVNDLLDVSRINQGRIADNPEEFNVVWLIERIIQDSKLQASPQKISLNFDQGNVQNLKLDLDPNLFTRVVESLLSNAIKYNKPKGKVDIKLKQSSSKLEIIVSDTGIGIPNKNMPQIFDKFFRAENVALAEAEGTGLGLYVAKSYLERWNGGIKLVSKEGEGTVATIELPI